MLRASKGVGRALWGWIGIERTVYIYEILKGLIILNKNKGYFRSLEKEIVIPQQMVHLYKFFISKRPSRKKNRRKVQLPFSVCNGTI